jgi:hypothetical protein
MNEAHQMYDDLLEALEPILPRTVYHDVRRVRTLAWAITGLCLSHTVRLGAWTQVADQPRTVCRQPCPPFLSLAPSSCHSPTGVV